jgi:hypothetical protein
MGALLFYDMGAAPALDRPTIGIIGRFVAHGKRK